jgi:hypothetical protein
LIDAIWSDMSLRIKLDLNSSLWWHSTLDPLVIIGAIDGINKHVDRTSCILVNSCSLVLKLEILIPTYIYFMTIKLVM